MGADEADFGFRPVLFDGFRDFAIVFERRRRGVDDDVIVTFGLIEAFFDINPVRWAVHELRVGNQGGGLCQPGGIPITGYLTTGLIARTGAAIKTIEAGRAKEQGFHSFIW